MIAVLFGYACRNATLESGSYEIGGDYAGVAASTVEKQFPGSIALFLRLCDGDQSPAPRGSEALANRHGDCTGCGSDARAQINDAARLRPSARNFD